MRLFISINLPEDTRGRIVSFQTSLKKFSKQGNFSLPENLHLTLVFIGEVDIRRLNHILQTVDSIPYPATSFRIEGSEFFKRDGGNILWLGVKAYDGLAKIQMYLNDELKKYGFQLDDRSFKPHLTLARECIIDKDAVMPIFEPETVAVTRVSLMKSERIADKLKYTEIHGKDLK